ncbi:cupredoxin domain-containing protein [Candidatus Kaiserbacteria bacterium]|nr:cupredoxin domain-containing protein [Candidatus Kaiserbacteria bacterium]
MQYLLLVIIAGVLLGGGYFWYGQWTSENKPPQMGIEDFIPPSGRDTPTNPSMNVTPTKTTGVQPQKTTDTKPSADKSEIIQEFSFTNEGYAYLPAAFAVKKGDRVKATFKNTGGTHDFRIDGYNVGTNIIQAGQSQTFEFVADTPGTFEFYCSVGNHRAMGMKGTFTVTP